MDDGYNYDGKYKIGIFYLKLGLGLILRKFSRHDKFAKISKF